jgi:uncharacterized membrane protein YhfC
LTTFVRTLDHVRLLVTLINLDAKRRRRWWRLLSLMLLHRMDGGSRRSYYRRATFVESPGICCIYALLVGVQGIAQNKLNLALGTREGKTFRILG